MIAPSFWKPRLFAFCIFPVNFNFSIPKVPEESICRRRFSNSREMSGNP